MLRILDELRKTAPGATMDQAATFATIAAERETTQQDIMRINGFTKAAVSRHIQALGPLRVIPPEEPGGKSKQIGGPDLIVQDTDARDMRRTVLTLSKKGRLVKEALDRLLQPKG